MDTMKMLFIQTGYKKLICADLDDDLAVSVTHSTRHGIYFPDQKRKATSLVNLNAYFSSKSLPPKPAIIYSFIFRIEPTHTA